jgi:hypothetical protein
MNIYTSIFILNIVLHAGIAKYAFNSKQIWKSILQDDEYYPLLKVMLSLHEIM